MNERQLHSFILSADTKSFSKAAALSFISTPALVQQINLLEANIGFKLFVRTNHGITLTPSGTLFYKEASKILRIFENACTQGQELERNNNLALRIACPFEKVPAFVFDAYENFRKDFPEASIEFVPLPFNEHINALLDGVADLSIIAEPAPEFIEGLVFEPLYEDTFSFCMSPNHPLAKLALITPKELKNVKVISGKYNYVKKPSSKNLSSYAKVTHIDKEYDLSTCAQLLVSDEMMVIHSLWGKNYESILKVVPSNITAGTIGILYRESHSCSVDAFLPYLEKTK